MTSISPAAIVCDPMMKMGKTMAIMELDYALDASRKIRRINMVLRVILQIVPCGDEDATREIGRLDIFNKGNAEFPTSGHYTYGIIDLSPKQEGMLEHDIHFKRAYGAWQLVHCATEELEGP